jgi:hypothetical protein
MADTLGSVLGRVEFIMGLRFGVVAVVLGLAAAVVWRSRRPLPAAGLLFTTAFAGALAETLGLPAGLGFGLAALAGAGLASGLLVGRPPAAILAVPGAWLVLSRSGLTLEPWAVVLLGATIVIGGWLLADFDTRWRRQPLGPPLLAVSVAGVYSTVPDTEQALVALGAALPLAFLAWPWPLASLGRAGAYAACGSLLWIVAAGGVGRGSALVGGAACLGLLAVEPVARLLDPGRESVLGCLPGGYRGAAMAAALHLLLVYVAARVAGMRPGAVEAALVTMVAFAVSVGLALVATAARRRLAARRAGSNSDEGRRAHST